MRIWKNVSSSIGANCSPDTKSQSIDVTPPTISSGDVWIYPRAVEDPDARKCSRLIWTLELTNWERVRQCNRDSVCEWQQVLGNRIATVGENLWLSVVLVLTHLQWYPHLWVSPNTRQAMRNFDTGVHNAMGNDVNRWAELVKVGKVFMYLLSIP